MVSVLISCMGQTDRSIISRCNVQTDVIVINQCDMESVETFTFLNSNAQACQAVFVNTKERGLSRSRNMAMRYAKTNSICLLCDDDEVLEEGYDRKILEGYETYPDADVIAFALHWNAFGKRYSDKSYSLTFRDTLKVCSAQISFRINSIRKSNIKFDEMMGSGTGNGAGEENKFMLNCRRAGLRMYYFPNSIATINSSASIWFHGYTNEYFENVGWSSRRIYGNYFLSLMAIMYLSMAKYRLYKAESTLYNAFRRMLKGLNEKR